MQLQDVCPSKAFFRISTLGQLGYSFLVQKVLQREQAESVQLAVNRAIQKQFAQPVKITITLGSSTKQPSAMQPVQSAIIPTYSTKFARSVPMTV